MTSKVRLYLLNTASLWLNATPREKVSEEKTSAAAKNVQGKTSLRGDYSWGLPWLRNGKARACGSSRARPSWEWRDDSEHAWVRRSGGLQDQRCYKYYARRWCRFAIGHFCQWVGQADSKTAPAWGGGRGGQSSPQPSKPSRLLLETTS